MSRLLFVFSQPPHGRINAQEGFDALLMGSAFAECSALFIGEGVLQLVNHQQPEAQGFKNYTLGFSALKDYGVLHIACSQSALNHYGLAEDDLIIPVERLDAVSQRQWLSDFEKVLTF
ncbi:MAG: tRNA 2-thiouridine synthesizing protein C [Candidatus Azotimanducaceae bacterium]|jgi:tRNA 2-thiouridine synthesizing protein C